jgi:plastocyanin
MMGRVRGWVAVVAGLAWGLPLCAAELDVRVADQRGTPVADAVVTLTPRAGSEMTTAPRPPARTHFIDQKDETFVPYLEVFRPGDSVVFRNSDRTRHHVYSFAPARQFEFMLAPGESSQPLQLDKPGVIATGCNIHDQMITYLYVTDAAVVARSDKTGRVHIGDLAPGAYDVRAWQPLLRPGSADNLQLLTIADKGDSRLLVFALPLLPDPRAKRDRERVSY